MVASVGPDGLCPFSISYERLAEMSLQGSIGTASTNENTWRGGRQRRRRGTNNDLMCNVFKAKKEREMGQKFRLQKKENHSKRLLLFLQMEKVSKTVCEREDLFLSCTVVRSCSTTQPTTHS